jgi:hypothetical protein
MPQQWDALWVEICGTTPDEITRLVRHGPIPLRFKRKNIILLQLVKRRTTTVVRSDAAELKDRNYWAEELNEGAAKAEPTKIEPLNYECPAESRSTSSSGGR